MSLNYSDLANKIQEIAEEVAPDYPNILSVGACEQLYAIHSSYEGCRMANEDMHQLVEVLRKRLNMTVEETADLGLSIMYPKEGKK